MQARRQWWRRGPGPGHRRTPRDRGRGRPSSANGASSFHLRWAQVPALSEVSVTLEVIEEPSVDELYFWALQADFASSTGAVAGGAHLGLQWYPRHPGSRAVNWGGYDGRGAELRGSESALASATHNPNTRDLAWEGSVGYRLTVGLAPDDDQPPVEVATAWRGTVTDQRTGDVVVVRDLYPAGDRITSVSMWSEVFAPCDAPPVTVRWSEPEGRTLLGERWSPSAVVATYQGYEQGGCPDTDSLPDGVGVLQRTGVGRTTPHGTRLGVPPRAPRLR